MQQELRIAQESILVLSDENHRLPALQNSLIRQNRELELSQRESMSVRLAGRKAGMSYSSSKWDAKSLLVIYLFTSGALPELICY